VQGFQKDVFADDEGARGHHARGLERALPAGPARVHCAATRRCIRKKMIRRRISRRRKKEVMAPVI
jgi:hypothetical protein